jgi:hypothetical protein
MGNKWSLDEIFEDLDAHHHDSSEDEPEGLYDIEDVEHAINYAREDILERIKDYVWAERERISKNIKNSNQTEWRHHNEGMLNSLDNLYESMVDKNFMAELLENKGN